MLVERHVIDLDDLGYILINFLDQRFRGDPNSYENSQYVYRELLAQMLLAYSTDEQEASLRLLGLPDMVMFKHLPILSYPDVFRSLVEIVQHVGQALHKKIKSFCDPTEAMQCFFDSASYTYLIFIKQS